MNQWPSRKRARLLRGMLTACAAFVLSGVISLAAQNDQSNNNNAAALQNPAANQPAVRAVGQITYANSVSVNDAAAKPGQTVFTGSRIKVGNAGMALINLGRYGRVELGSLADFTLKFSADLVGGELADGCMLITTPSGIKVDITTPRGAITTTGATPASLTLGLQDNLGHFIDDLGDGTVAAGGKSEPIKPGQYIAVSWDGKDKAAFRVREAVECGLGAGSGQRLICTCRMKTIAGLKGNPSTPSGSIGVPPLVSIIGGATITAIIIGTGGGGDTTGLDNSGITCLERQGPFCLKISPVSLLQ